MGYVLRTCGVAKSRCVQLVQRFGNVEGSSYFLPSKCHYKYYDRSKHCDKFKTKESSRGEEERRSAHSTQGLVRSTGSTTDSEQENMQRISDSHAGRAVERLNVVQVSV